MFRQAEKSWLGWKVVLLALASMLLLALHPVARAQQPAIDVVATIGMIGDVAGEIAGPCGRITTLMGPGVDPHLYQPTSGDVRDLQNADLILYAGLSLEGQLGEVLDRFSQRTPTVAVSDRAVPVANRIAASEGYAYDPHVWMDASLWADAVFVIADALAERAPGCADAMHARADRYAMELRALHGWMRDALATIPEGQRVLVTAHDAFEYFGRAYGLELAAIQGISTESEASLADIRSVTRLIVEQGVPAVFVETTIAPRTLQAVLDAARDQGSRVTLGGDLYGDALGEAGTLAGSYLGMMIVNTRTIVEALGGTLPDLPSELDAWRERSGAR